MLFRARSLGWLLLVALAFVLAARRCGPSKFVAPHPRAPTLIQARTLTPTRRSRPPSTSTTPPKDEIFGTNYVQNGILPVLLIVTNSGDQPILMTKMHAQLVTASRSKLEALEVDDVFRRVAHIKASSTTPPRVGPIPLPTGAKNKKAQEQYQELTKAVFIAEAVEPHTTKSGFLFFDIQDIKSPVVGGHIYLTGIRDSTGNELMYFEIPLIAGNAAKP